MFKHQPNLRGFITVIALFMSFVTFAQNTITGTVKDDKNLPIPGVSIVIKGSVRGTVSDSKGNFTIKNVAAGKASVMASFVGQKSVTESIDVTSGSNTLNFTLHPSVYCFSWCKDNLKLLASKIFVNIFFKTFSF